MPTELLCGGVWGRITKAVKAAKRPCQVAVAYFGEGGSRQLPLCKGSRLVVNASEGMVKRGETCPADLIELQSRGVRIFSEPTLHAKVFVIGKAAFIGSANVSKNSANVWREAVVRTTDPSTVKASRAFVESFRYMELGPESLEKLKGIYHRPTNVGVPHVKRRAPRKKSGQTMPRLFLVQLKDVDYSEEEQGRSDQGRLAVRKYRKHPRVWKQEEFRWIGKNPFKRDDRIIQIHTDENGKALVAVPAIVYGIDPPKKMKGKSVSFVYLERPDHRRRSVESVAKKIGCSAKKLLTNRQVRQHNFALNLLDALGG